MKPSFAATLKTLFQMNEMDLVWLVFFVAFIMALTWYLFTCNGSRTASRPAEDDSFETLQDQWGLFKLRLRNLNDMLTCGKRAMGQLDFGSALEVFNEGIDYARANKMVQTQDLRNTWAKLHEMKSLCYCRQHKFFESMKEMDAALTVARYPSAILMKRANHLFQLFKKWCSENIEWERVEILDYFKEKFSCLEKACDLGFTYPHFLLESTHCLLLADMLTSAGVCEIASINKVRSLCVHFRKQLPVLDHSSSHLLSTKVNIIGMADSSDLQNGSRYDTVSIKMAKNNSRSSISSQFARSSADGQSQTPAKNKPSLIQVNEEMKKETTLKDAKNLTRRQTGTDIQGNGVISVKAACDKSKKRKRGIKNFQDPENHEHQPSPELLEAVCVEQHQQTNHEFPGHATEFFPTSDNFKVLPPNAINIFENEKKPHIQEPRSSSVKLFAELSGCYGSIHLACDMCLVMRDEWTNNVRIGHRQHDCTKNRLVVIEKTSPKHLGKLIRVRPWEYKPCQTLNLCESAFKGETCIEKQRCPFPHSDVEKSLWQRDFNGEISILHFIEDLDKSSLRVKHLVGYLTKRYSGEFKLFCKTCFVENGRREQNLKVRHVPKCQQGHLWKENEFLAFQKSAQFAAEVITFEHLDPDLNPDNSELVNCVLNLKKFGMAWIDIAEESRRLLQQVASGVVVNKVEDLSVATELETNLDESPDKELIDAEKNKSEFDDDVDEILDPRAFDDDTGDQPGGKDAEKQAETASFDPYYPLLTEEHRRNTSQYRQGTIRLIGLHNAVCRLKDGTDLEISGRMNCGPAFDGDEVLVEIKEIRSSGVASSESTKNVNYSGSVVRGTVVALVKRNTHRVARTFVCMVDKNRGNLMRPLCGTLPKFHVVDSELERKHGREKKLGYVAVYKMGEHGLEREKIVPLTPKSHEEMLFVVKYLKWNPKHMYPLGYVCKIIHCGKDFGASLNVLNLLYEIPAREPQEDCDECINKYSEFIQSERFCAVDKNERQDRRELLTLSVDPRSCKEVDDALSIVRHEDGSFTVFVHIVDIGHFIRKGDAVDMVAKRRAMSFYPEGSRRPIYMLHSGLATNLLSLLQDQDRYAITVVLEMNSEGELLRSPLVVRSLIRNKKQMIYEDVQEIIDSHGELEPEAAETEIDQSIIYLHRLAKKLRAGRMRHAQYYYDYEIRSFLKSEGIGDPFKVDQNHDAHRLVEEFMILTNKSVAEFLLAKFPWNVVPVRQQDEPNDSRVSDWNSRHKMIRSLSFYFDHFRRRFEAQDDELVDVEQLNHSSVMLEWSWKSLKQAVENNDAKKVRTIVGSERLHPIHSLALSEWFVIQESAKFAPASTNSEHFGLQLSHYTQFTSPLRRFMDVVIHRLVNAAIDDNDAPYSAFEIQELCEKANFRKSLAKSYEKSCTVLKMAHLLVTPFYLPCFIEKFDLFSIRVNVPFFQHRKQQQQLIKYSSLAVHSAPKVDGNRSVALCWEKRLYDTKRHMTQNARMVSSNDELFVLNSEHHGKRISHENWRSMQTAITENETDENLLRRMSVVLGAISAERGIQYLAGIARNPVMEVTSEMQASQPLVKHHVRFSVHLQPGSLLAVQFGNEVIDGFLQPEVRLINLTNGKDLCIEHRLKPVKCFASTATQKTKQRYNDITEYQQIWIPILHMESATNAASSEDPVMCDHIPVKLEHRNRMLLGQLELDAEFCRVRHIKLFVRSEQEKESHDYLCIRYHWDSKYPQSLIRNVWVCHAVALRTEVTNSHSTKSHKKHANVQQRQERVVLRFRVRKYSSEPPIELLEGKQDCTVEFLYRTLPDKRMAKSVDSLLLPESSELCRKIALGLDVSTIIEPRLACFSAQSFNIDDIHVNGVRKFIMNNKSQEQAIRTSLSERFTLVQGPPGTGKTLIGVKIAYWFVQMNLKSKGNPENLDVPCQELSESESEDDDFSEQEESYEFLNPVYRRVHRRRNRGQKQVLFCGPSNSSVDVAAKQLLTRLGDKCPKIVRVYSEMRETIDFPIPRDLLIKNLKEHNQNRNHSLQDDPEIQKISLHRIIREDGKSFSNRIKKYDKQFSYNMKTPEMITDEEVMKYQKLILDACTEELKNYDIILSTCSASASARLIRGANIAQIVIDECAMCMEPESLIPLVNFPRTERIVLIGDHKQLQPIIMNQEAKKLGLNISLFQRYAETAHPHFVMLDVQYRMNEKICEFPSLYFYEAKLKTALNSRWFKREDHFLKIWPNVSYPMVFCHVEGVEKSQAVTTSEANEESKSNEEECHHVLRIARELINTLSLIEKYNRHPDKNIAILTQYKAQCTAIKTELVQTGLECNVSTVVASQGGEWDYVILSTVRSLPEYEIDKHPSDGWCMKHLGFICDPHQINVALTRARMGLIIVGNKNLLRCDKMWKELLKHYESHGCIINAEDFLKTALIPGYAHHLIPRLSRRPPSDTGV